MRALHLPMAAARGSRAQDLPHLQESLLEREAGEEAKSGSHGRGDGLIMTHLSTAMHGDPQKRSISTGFSRYLLSEPVDTSQVPASHSSRLSPTGKHETKEQPVMLPVPHRATPALRALAQSLRRNATTTEQALWARLNHRQFLGLKFRRQHIALGYILDFYCPEYRLGIELDGVRHDATRDAERDLLFVRWHVTILRFPAQKPQDGDRKSTRLNSSHTVISYAVFCLKKKNDVIPSQIQCQTRVYLWELELD